jgi:hypothetical protein
MIKTKKGRQWKHKDTGHIHTEERVSHLMSRTLIVDDQGKEHWLYDLEEVKREDEMKL